MPTWYMEHRISILLFQSVIGVLPFGSYLAKRKNFAVRFIVGTLIGFFLIGLFVHTGLFDISSLRCGFMRVVASLVVFLFTIIVCYISFEENFYTALFVASSGYIAQDISGTVKTVFKLIPGISEMSTVLSGVILIDVIVYGLVYIVLFIMFRPYTRKRESIFHNKEKAVFSAGALIFCIGMARLSQDNYDRNNLAVGAEAIYQILCDFFILLLQFGVMERVELRNGVDTMKELMHQQYDQMKRSKESIELVNEKYHDLKGILDGYELELPKDQLRALKKKIEEYEEFVSTGNHILDVVIAEKKELCSRENIELTTLVNGAELSFMDDVDIYSLFGNAFNNAIHATKKLPEDERFIMLTVSSGGGTITIHIENSFDGNVVMENGIPKSLRDPRYHGFGMRSMERIVKKYDGTIAVKAEGKVFKLDIIML
ncbi:MAG: GHKL domain-containing protein [Butyrivibrio sp.]|uniref:GHKL domain-containing protein n=1 Tax=Butyrivibrio sp. TaxID=28121 RepID=UPI001B19757D|nr:GHKL domain-containing protein [Butyrivibrio sp.]MBO6242130.1 GHKL domain-containing protein [Butyrivibrio sp.]